MTKNKISMNEHNKKKREGQYTRQDEVLELLAELGRSPPRLIYRHDDTDIHPSRCNKALRQLLNRGLVEQIDEGLYEITPAGRERLEYARENDLPRSFTDD